MTHVNDLIKHEYFSLQDKRVLIGRMSPDMGKYKEISALLPKRLKKISPIKFGIKPPKETGKTFKDNSVLKAKYFASKSGLYSISDDSGLEVTALNNRPGGYSARWAKKLGGFKKAMEKIIKAEIQMRDGKE